MTPVAIVGVGETPYATTSSRSMEQLVCDAVFAALDDAGLSAHDVDGFIADEEWARRVMPMNELASTLGIQRTFGINAPPPGAGNTYAPLLAKMALDAGQASVIVHYLPVDVGTSVPGLAQFRYTDEGMDREAFEYPMGLVGTPLYYAHTLERYRHLYGLTDEELGAVAVTIRNNALLHPGAQMQREVSIDDYLASPLVCGRLRLLDCCIRTTGAATGGQGMNVGTSFAQVGAPPPGSPAQPFAGAMGAAPMSQQASTGTAAGAAAPSAGRNCSNCGAPLAADAAFCSRCGTKAA
jgi:acetyl-CoA acetyltransferase